jgi:mono/diheme cytochrome c family protein
MTLKMLGLADTAGPPATRPALSYILESMRKASILIALLPVLGSLGFAQDDAQYQAWMKSIPPAVRAIRNATDTAAAAGDATKLADTFDKVAAFWKARNADDAVKFAVTAADAAKAIASGSGDKAANLQTLQGTCGGCHSAHREGSAPDFKIK